jgi:two-component system cell cycle sensor histidine kinase/response regulator CckA
MVSPAAHNIFGAAEPEAFLGRPVTDFLVPEDRARAMAQVELRRQGVMPGPSEYRGLRLDGSTFDIEVNSEFMRDAGGSPTGMVVIVRDITERKRAAVERGRLEALNSQLQKSESLRRMAGAIAHHFNNQLQGVMMNLELAINDLSKHEDPVECLTGAMESARRAAEVSTLMLTYLGHAHGEREALDLTEICRLSLPLLRVVLPHSVDLMTDLSSPGPVVSADANQIQQVITNLVTNAWEASAGDRGEIHLAVKTVAAGDVATTHRLPVDWQPYDAAYACLEVSDAGSGISGEDIEQLFDPFFSSKFTGRGLGLPVVLGIARAHGGAVTVESKPGRGSVFRVFLPLSTKAVN